MAWRFGIISSNGTSSRALLPALVVAGTLLLLLWPVLFGDQTLFYRDLYRQHLGTARLLHNGLPNGLLWDPLLNGGQPLLGNPNRFVLYPTRVLYLLLAPLTALNWEITLHLLLGGLGGGLLARRLGLGGTGSTVTGLAYALGGFSISLTNHLGRLFAYHWLPWIVLAVVAASSRSPAARWWRAAVPLLLAVQWLTGAAELAMMAAALAFTWAFLPSLNNGEHRIFPGRTSGWIVLGACLAAIQVLPAAEMVLRSERTAQAGTVLPLAWSLNPLRFPEFLISGFCGPVDVADPATSYWGAGLIDFGFPYLLSLYLGVSVVLLAAIGWVASGRDPRWRVLRRLLGVLAGAGLLFAFGRHVPGLGTVLALIPGLSLVRFPVKMVLVAGLPVALLAGYGSDRLWDADGVGRRQIIRLAACASGFLLLVAVSVVAGIADPALALVFGEGAAEASEGLFVPLLHSLLAAAGVTVAALSAGKLRRPAPSLLLTAVVVADLLGAAIGSLPTGPREAFQKAPELLAPIRTSVGDGRFFRDEDPDIVFLPLAADRAWAPAAWWSEVLAGPLAANWGVPMIFNPDSEVLASRRMANLKRSISSLEWEGRLKVLRVAAGTIVMTPQVREVRGLETVATSTPAEGLTYVVDRVQPTPPLVRWIGGTLVVPTGGEALKRLTSADFDPDREVVRESSALVARRAPRFLAFLQPKSELWHGELRAPGDGFAVAAVPWHPDLIVEVDGQPVRAERLNYAFTGVPVGAGGHSVRILFVPRSVMWGGLISAASLLLWAACLIAGRGRGCW